MHIPALKAIKEQSIYRNSIYLVLSTGILAVSGFVFWWLAAKLTSSVSIGIAASLISVTTYIGIVSQLGFNVSVIRFLPTSMNPERIINTAIAIVSGTALVASLIFLFGSGWIADSLGFLRNEFFLGALFIFFVIFSALNIIIESIFIAFRKSKNVFAKNSILSLLRIGLIFPLMYLGGFGLFASWAAAIVISVGISVLYLPIALRRNMRLHIYQDVFKEVAAFSGGNYIASLTGNICVYAVPVILLAIAGPRNTAYFSIAMSFATLLFSIPVSVCNSLLAEGAADEGRSRSATIKAIKLITVLSAPAMLVLALFGKNLLSLFGPEYVAHASGLLSIMVVSSIFFSANTVCWALLNLERRVWEIAAVLSLNSFIILSLTYFWGRSSLLGAGLAWLTGQIITTIVYLMVLFILPSVKRAQFQSETP